MYQRYLLLISVPILFSCHGRIEEADAYGNFEAVEILVSSEAQGQILEFRPEEGDRLGKGEVVVLIDTTQLYLKMRQLISGKGSLEARKKIIEARLGVSRVQLANLERERERVDRLFEGGAATSRQRDDLHGQVEILKAQMAATESQRLSVIAEESTLEIQIRQVQDQIRKCTIRNPREGVVLAKYRERGELAAPGQPLYKITGMEKLILRAYITGEQLSEARVGEEVIVRFDRKGGMGESRGFITWISPQAEFTPRIIQTREERVSLVYAMKVEVPNDGSLKIGMPGELFFSK